MSQGRSERIPGAGAGAPRGGGGALPVVAGLVLVVALSFWPVLSNGFINYDDQLYVTENLHVRGGLTWEGVRWALLPSEDASTYWSPLTWLSLMADVEVFGVRPEPIHAVNLVIHAASAVLLFLALSRMSGQARLAAAVAFVWAVHPLNVEAVAWAAERKTVLAGVFAFGTLLAYARYVERPGAGRYAWVVGLFSLSLLAKQMVAGTLPALLLVLDVWPLGRTRWARAERDDLVLSPLPLRTLVVEKLPLLAATLLVTGLIAAAIPLTGGVPWAARAGQAVVGYWEYVGKTFWPGRLAVFYPLGNPPAAVEWVTAGAALAAVTGALLWRPVPRAAAVGWLWFLGTLLPFTGILRHATKDGMWPRVADRFMYLPLVGLLVAVVFAGAVGLRSGRQRRVAGAFVALVVGAAAVRTHAYALRWRDSETLYRTSIAAAGSTHLRANLGKALEAQGRVEEARAVYEELVRVAPQLPSGHVNLGLLRHVEGDLAGAEAHYRRAIAVDPSCGEALYNLALLARSGGREEESLGLFERAVGSGFAKGAAYNHLGLGYRREGREVEAERAFREGLRRDAAEWQAAVNLAWMMAERGRAAEARGLLEEAKERAQRAGADPARVDAAARRLGEP